MHGCEVYAITANSRDIRGKCARSARLTKGKALEVPPCLVGQRETTADSDAATTVLMSTERDRDASKHAGSR